jgi:UDP-GlcNAc3NAcA epimerase
MALEYQLHRKVGPRMNHRVLTIYGTRPQILKSVMISRALMAAGIEETLVHTGQHYSPELSQIFLDEFAITPHYNLDIGQASPVQQTAAIMSKLEPILLTEKPDIVLILGDTTSALAGALCASKLRIPIAHVEAGPRQYSMDIPEEVNRKLTDHLSTLLFAPTHHSINNLWDEGLQHPGLHMTGDVTLDLFNQYWPSAKALNNDFILVTIHHPLNTDNRKQLENIVDSIYKLQKTENIIFPAHPRTMAAISEFASINVYSHIGLRHPFSYLDTLSALKGAKLVITDSSGLQREAYFARVPCLVLDSPSPWPEIIETGWQKLATPATLAKLALTPWQLTPDDHNPQLFGNGHAAEKMVQILTKYFSNSKHLKNSRKETTQ